MKNLALLLILLVNLSSCKEERIADPLYNIEGAWIPKTHYFESRAIEPAPPTDSPSAVTRISFSQNGTVTHEKISSGKVIDIRESSYTLQGAELVMPTDYYSWMYSTAGRTQIRMINSDILEIKGVYYIDQYNQGFEIIRLERY